MYETPHSTRQQHGNGIKDIHEPFMRGDGIVESDTRGELDQPVDDPYSDSKQTEIQGVQ